MIINLAIVAHIDHGKSTLSTKLIESFKNYRFRSQTFLDNLSVEINRGITVRAQTISLVDIDELKINMIDTPGHIEFQGEVIKSLDVSNFVMMVISVLDGPQAQTYNYLQLVLKRNIPYFVVFNKIDFANYEQIRKSFQQYRETVNSQLCFGIKYISSKNNFQIKELKDYFLKLIENDQIKELVNTHKSKLMLENKGLITLGSYQDKNGTQVLVNAFEKLQVSDKLYYLDDKNQCKVTKIRNIYKLDPFMINKNVLDKLDLGYLTLTDIQPMKVNTVMSTDKEYVVESKKNKVTNPIIHIFQSSITPVSEDDYSKLKEALLELASSDYYLSFDEMTHPFLGKSFNCKFSGPLHAEVVEERLKEYNLKIYMSKMLPVYKIITRNGIEHSIYKDDKDDPIKIVYEAQMRIMFEIAETKFYTFLEYLKKNNIKIISIEDNKLLLELSANDFISEKFQSLFAIASGMMMYNLISTEWCPIDYKIIDFRINNKPMNITTLSNKEYAHSLSKDILKELSMGFKTTAVPITLQAFSGNTVFASLKIVPYSKNVTSKCYGGDQTRKDKLLKRQQKGKQFLKDTSAIKFHKELLFDR